jgi:hypothetical protein
MASVFLDNLERKAKTPLTRSKPICYYGSGDGWMRPEPPAKNPGDTQRVRGFAGPDGRREK